MSSRQLAIVVAMFHNNAKLQVRGHSNNTWGGGEGEGMSHRLYLHFEALFSTFGSEKFCVTARLASLRYFLYNAFSYSSQIRLKKISDQKQKNVTRGGGGVGNMQKSVTYYLNDVIDEVCLNVHLLLEYLFYIRMKTLRFCAKELFQSN